MIPEAAVEAAAKVTFEGLHDDEKWSDVTPAEREPYERQARAALEAAAPHMLAEVVALADAWEARGEHDMAYSKTILDEDIAMEILTSGAQMVENARHIRNALRHTL